jgi:hypothetical protein
MPEALRDQAVRHHKFFLRRTSVQYHLMHLDFFAHLSIRLINLRWHLGLLLISSL